MISINTKLVLRGIRILSFIGDGRLSTVMATAAAISAISGVTKNTPAKKAKKKPKSEPPNVFPLLNGNGFVGIKPPKNEAALSPKANIAIEALFMGGGNSNNVNSIPVAK